MPGTISNNYQSIGTMNQGASGPMGKKFYPIVVGNTLGTHSAFIRRLQAIGQIQVTSPDQCDYFLVFCPIVSRAGTDIDEAMGKIPGGKKAILVVMHHTINRDGFVDKSHRHVSNPDVIRTVDCLFHENRFLDCARNDDAFNEIRGVVDGLQDQNRMPGLHRYKNRRCLLLLLVTFILIVILLIVVLSLILKK